ncbi:hypothetical protein II906_06310 [bacterium]|nr:hypothetical protein [bacterium]
MALGYSYDTADMFFLIIYKEPGIIDQIHAGIRKPNSPKFSNIKNWDNSQFVPCWSLGALLKLMNRPHINYFGKNNIRCSSVNKNSMFVETQSNDYVEVCFKHLVKLREVK